MPRPEKTSEIDRILEVIIKNDARRRGTDEQIVSDELIEAMDYYVRWGLARSRGRALIELAKPMAGEVVQRVRKVGIKAVEELSGATIPVSSDQPSKSARSSRRRSKPETEE
jgi:hypothetical protein